MKGDNASMDLRLDRTKRNIIAALLITSSLTAIEVTIVGVAMPKIAERLGGFHLISWVFAIYLLTMAVSAPIWGKLTDTLGRKFTAVAGISIFVASSALCGFSVNMEMLILFRFLQGIGAGAIQPASFAIVADVFPFEQRAKVQGLLTTVWAVAGLFRPLLGGVLVDYLHWRWIFFVNVPFGIISIWLIGRHFAETMNRRKARVDYGGAITFSLGISLLLLALLSFEGEEGTGAWAEALGGFAPALMGAAAVAILALFLYLQSRHPEPIMPLRLFRIPEVTISIGAAFLINTILIGLQAYVPIWTQKVLGFGATAAGLTLIPQCVGWPLGANICGRAVPAFGTRKVILTGLVLIVIGSAGMAAITRETALWILVLNVLVMGIGFGLAATALTVVLQSSVGKEFRGIAGSLNSLMRTMGKTIGAAVLGAVMFRYTGADPSGGSIPAPLMEAGLHAVFVCFAILSVLSLLLALWFPKRPAEQPGH